MGLFDKLKDQALNGLNEFQEKINNVQNQQSAVTPPSAQQPSQSANSEGIYGNYLEHLIDMALADGELTEKENKFFSRKLKQMVLISMNLKWF